MKLHMKSRSSSAGVLVIGATALLTACGGGGGGGTSVATFIDAAVSGLEYSSTSHSGVTDALGNFEYKAGEPVTFSIGNVVLGTVVPKGNVVRPLDLVAEASSDTDARVTRILQTLQSVDENASLTDGIQISAATREHMRVSTTTKLHLDHSSTTDVEVEHALPSGTYTVTPDEARIHYEQHMEDGSNADRGYTPPPSTSTPMAQPASTSGRLLASNCFQCHGTGGLGGFERIRGGEANEVFGYTSLGASSSIMAAHAQGFTPAQLQAIVTYLHQ